jgi:hypothetical protein
MKNDRGHLVLSRKPGESIEVYAPEHITLRIQA